MSNNQPAIAFSTDMPILDLVNENYQQAVYEANQKLNYVIQQYQENEPECTPYLKALKIYEIALMDMMFQHEIDDLEWSGSFVPSFDWISLNKWNVDSYFDIEDHGYNCAKVYEDLRALESLGIINNLEQTIVDEESLICSFTVVGWDLSSLKTFDMSFRRLRGSIFAFYNC